MTRGQTILGNFELGVIKEGGSLDTATGVHVVQDRSVDRLSNNLIVRHFVPSMSFKERHVV